MEDTVYISSGYTLDLYCNKFKIEQDVVTTEGPRCYYQARLIARKIGWVLHKNGTATCPKCNK